MSSTDIKSLGSLVWSIAELRRGDFKQSEYGEVILPFVVLRRLDCILEETKPAVLEMAATPPEDMDDEARDAATYRIWRSLFIISLTCASSVVIIPHFSRCIIHARSINSTRTAFRRLEVKRA